MQSVVVTVYAGDSSSRDLDLPADVPIRVLAPLLAEAVQYEPADGKDVKYVVKHRGSSSALNPERTLSSAGVVHGDELQLLVKAVPAELAETGQKFAGPGFVSRAGDVFPLRMGNVLIGREDRRSGVTANVLGVDLTRLDGDAQSVSRRHAQVLHRDGIYLVVDLMSTNGTAVNGQPLVKAERIELNHGDRVRFGDVELLFIWDSQEPN